VRRRSTTKGGRVTSGCGSRRALFAADAVASNADVVHTYRELLASIRAAEGRKALAKKRWSNSLFVLYFGLNHHHSQLRHHTVCFGPRYRELIGDIFKDGLADDFSLYLHAPCVTDPSLAPPGLRQPSTCWRWCPPGQPPTSTGTEEGPATATRS
jgi:phytoene desaturase